MRKIKIIIFALIIMFSSVSFVNASSDAKTLAELRTALNNLKKQKNAQDAKKRNTKSQINSAQNNIYNSKNAIDEGRNKIETAKKEIEELTFDISKGKESIKELLNQYQQSKSDNIYLEYLFKATSYADLIYRYGILEQLIDFKDAQIDSWKEKITKNEELQKDLEAKEIELNNNIASLEKSITSLNNNLSEITEITMDIQDEIDATSELIKYYTNLGCKENENLDACVNVKGDTGFRKPLVKGTITSYFGYRIHPIYGYSKFHSGTDIGGNKEGTNVYASANGKVGMIISNTSKKTCGGKQVYIYHTINGKKYTTAYLHLLSINVKVGDSVTSNTVIGLVGGGSKTQSWESCSTGAHLHFTIAEGWYGSTYSSYSTFLAKTLDPKKILKLPNKYTYWYSR